MRTDENGRPYRPFRVLRGIFTGACPANSTKFYAEIGMRGHNGLDYACYYGEPIYHSADFDGWMKTEKDMDGGLGVDVISKEPLLNCSECGKFHYVKIRYWHLKEQTGYDGLQVKFGYQIGRGNSTGASSGNHLHFAPKFCDKEGKGLHKDNGFYGAISSTPYYENKFVLDEINDRDAPPEVVEDLTVEQELRKTIFELQMLVNQLIKFIVEYVNKLKGR